MNTELMFSSGKDDWETPNDFFQRYNAIYHFVLDAAANRTNAKCFVWLGPDSRIAEDALQISWRPYLEEGNIWLNPPYSRGLQKKFVEKALNEKTSYQLDSPPGVNHVVCLLPARTDTKIFHELVKPYASEIEFMKGRVKFKGASAGAPFPSMIVVF